MGALAVLGAIVVLALGAYALTLRRRVKQLQWRLDALESVAPRDGADPRAQVIVIDVRNVAEVAIRRTMAARPLATLAPGVLRSIVLRQTVRQMRSQLAAEGLDARVELRRLSHGPAPSAEPDHPVTDPADPDS